MVGVQGVAGDVIHAVVAGTLGRIGYAVPLILLAFGIYFLRAPDWAQVEDGEAVMNRLVVGTVALTFAACGLAHIADGIPNLPDGADPMRAAGGIIGFLASSPFASAVSRPPVPSCSWCLALFGALVVMGTPVRQIPQRFRDLRHRVLHGAKDDDAEDAAAAGHRLRAGAQSTCWRSATGTKYSNRPPSSHHRAGPPAASR